MDANASKGLIDKVSFLILALWIGILSVRLLIAPIDNLLIIISALCLTVFFFCHVCVVYLKSAFVAGCILMAVMCGSVLLITGLSGGIQSPSIIIYPLIPIITALLFGRALSWTLCFIMSLSVIVFYLYEINTAAIELYTGGQELHDRLVATWVIFSTTACTVFANFFHSENRRLNDALENQARIDHLTSLPNKRSIEECLRRESAVAVRTGGWISVIMLDIDFFKRYNDSHGHAKGDLCLQLIAVTLRNCLKRADDFLGRYGGEEFIVLLPDTNPEECLKIAENMRKSVQSLYDLRRDMLQEEVTITLGCFSTCGNSVLDMDDLVSRADRALYDGKRLGRNRVITSVDKRATQDQGKKNSVTDLNERRHRRRHDT